MRATPKAPTHAEWQGAIEIRARKPHCEARQILPPSLNPGTGARISIPVPAMMPPVTVAPIRTPVIHIPRRPPIVSWRVIARTIKISGIIARSIIARARNSD